MDYCEFTCDLKSLSNETQELLTVFLSEIGFESFMEDNGLYKAYIQTENFDKQALDETLHDAEPLFGTINYSIATIPSQDWNTIWESTFNYAEINNDILVRIPNYTPTKKYKHEIIIEPRMSFGSGTHETTSLILQTMEDYDFSNKSVADCGCGTGILGIFASKLGAHSVLAFDYDSCCVANTEINCNLNNINNITIHQAKLTILDGQQFDVVLANINKNILIENMKYIAQSINPNGIVYMSGFYSEDVADITQCANSFGLQFVKSKAKNNWTITIFIRK